MRADHSPLLSHDWFACCWRTAGPERKREAWVFEDDAGPLLPGAALVGARLGVRVHREGSGGVLLTTPRISARRVLRAGLLTAMLDGVDLRFVRWGDVEIARRIYVAVRDLNWGTVLPEILEVAVNESEDRFSVSCRCHHAEGPIGLQWKGTIAATSAPILIRFSETMDTRAVEASLSYGDGFSLYTIADGTVSWLATSSSDDTIRFSPRLEFASGGTVTVNVNGSVARVPSSRNIGSCDSLGGKLESYRPFSISTGMVIRGR